MKQIKYKFPDDYSFEEQKIIFLTGIEQAWLICQNTLDRAYEDGIIRRIERTQKKNAIYTLIKRYHSLLEGLGLTTNMKTIAISCKTLFSAAKSYSGIEGIEHFPSILFE